ARKAPSFMFSAARCRLPRSNSPSAAMASAKARCAPCRTARSMCASATPGGAPCFVTIVVPIDDETHMQWYIIYDPAKPIPDAARERLMAGSSGDRDDFASDLGGWDNRWNQDRGLMKQGHWN